MSGPLRKSDVGNGRILSVKLDYHTSQRTPLRDITDEARPEK